MSPGHGFGSRGDPNLLMGWGREPSGSQKNLFRQQTLPSPLPQRVNSAPRCSGHAGGMPDPKRLPTRGRA